MLTMFAALFELFIELGRTSERKLVQPLLIAACMTANCAAVHMPGQGGIAAGFSSAFPGNDADRMERRRIREQALMQAELRRFAAANKLIDQLPPTMPGRAPGASRVWLNMFQNGFTGLTGAGLLRYDVTDARAGSAVVDQPLSGWSDLLPGLIAGQCTLHRITELRAPSMVSQFETRSIYQTFGPVVAPSWPANEILCMTPVHPDHAFGRFRVAYGLQ